jgi:hypothetical protein
MRFARIFSAVLLLGASAAFAQIRDSGGNLISSVPAAPNARTEALAPQPETYGTSSLTWLTLNMFEFQPISSATTYTYEASNGYGMYRTGGAPYFEAPLHLPAGAIVSALELSACDTNATANLAAYSVAVSKLGVFSVPGGNASTTGSAGCQVAVAPAFTPWTVNNDANTYMIEANFGTVTDNSLKLVSVRVGYKLQISPDPTTATFADVPHGHPFHRFVEALVAAGITGGCGGGNYCPDAPVTRGQMAVFLAGALGLHWAP